jgi:hypothetical protein
MYTQDKTNLGDFGHRVACAPHERTLPPSPLSRYRIGLGHPISVARYDRDDARTGARFGQSTGTVRP